MRSTLTILLAAAVTAALAGTAAARRPVVIAEPPPDAAPLPDAPVPEPAVVPEPMALPTGGAIAAPPPIVPQPEIVIASPPPPPPEPPPREVPRSSVFAIGSALTARMPEGAGRLEDLGRGAALSLGWLQRRSDVPTGVMVRGMAIGNTQTRLYSLDVQLIASARLGRRLAVPYVGIGLAFGAARFAQGDKQAAAGMALGPAGGLGLHGFLADRVYWRAELSAIGAGAAVITGGLSLGWVVGS